MKDRLIGFLKTYCLFICIFALQKPFFMLFYRSLYEGVSWTEWLGVMWHGLPLDLSLAGYLTVVPGLLFICSAWTVSNLLRRIWYGYFAFISVLLSVIFTVDLGLYEYWGFRLDATPLFYFFSSPKDAVASVSIWVVIGGIIAMVAYAAALYGIFHGVLLRKRVFERMKIPYRRLRVSGVLLLLTGLLFIPIRGGFTVSTMNTGKVYFSTDQRLNHAAINPAFSLMESLSKQKDFGSQYRFMEADAADRIFFRFGRPCRSDAGRYFGRFPAAGSGFFAFVVYDKASRCAVYHHGEFLFVADDNAWGRTRRGRAVGQPGARGRSLHEFLCEQFPHRPRVGCHIERVSGTAHYQHNEVSP